MANAPIQVTGLREAQRAISQIDPTLRREMAGALREAVEPARAHVANTAPRRSGRTASSITTRVNRSSVAIGSRLPHIGPLMFGRRIPHPGHGHTRPHLRGNRPNPFIIEGVESSASSIEDRLAPRIQSVLDRLFPDS